MSACFYLGLVSFIMSFWESDMSVYTLLANKKHQGSHVKLVVPTMIADPSCASPLAYLLAPNKQPRPKVDAFAEH